MNDVVGPRQASIRTRQLIRAARTALGFDDSQPSEESSALVVPGSEARDRAFVQLVLAHIRGDAAACAELQSTFAAPGELAEAHAALGAVLVERAQRVLAEADRSSQGGTGGPDGRI